MNVILKERPIFAVKNMVANVNASLTLLDGLHPCLITSCITIDYRTCDRCSPGHYGFPDCKRKSAFFCKHH